MRDNISTSAAQQAFAVRGRRLLEVDNARGFCETALGIIGPALAALSKPVIARHLSVRRLLLRIDSLYAHLSSKQNF